MLALHWSIASNSFYFAECPQRCRLSRSQLWRKCWQCFISSQISMHRLQVRVSNFLSVSSFEYLPTKTKKFQSEFVISSETPSIILSTLLYYPGTHILYFVLWLLCLGKKDKIFSGVCGLVLHQFDTSCSHPRRGTWGEKIPYQLDL